jgi:subtilisin family serine protease
MRRVAVVAALLAVLPAGASPPRRTVDSRLRALALGAAPVQVYVRCAALGPAERDALRANGLGIELEDPALRTVQGRIAPAALEALAALPFVRAITPADRARPRAIDGEGDRAARADLVRAQGFDGAGVTVGVISDGIDGLGAAQAGGDLDGVSIPTDDRCRPGEGNEGTAMLEIVHALAPGARLLFSGAATSLEFIAAVRCLAAAGAAVIVDDLGFYAEPYFLDGPVAIAVRAVVQAGVVHVTAAGNDATRHVEQLYRSGGCGDLHTFGPASSVCTDHILMAPLDTLECTLQWNDPWGAAADDYDLLLVDETLAVVAAGDNLQRGAEDPIERVSWTNTASVPRRMGLQIRKVAGEARSLEMFCSDGPLDVSTPAGSIFGHPAVSEVVTVGAIDASVASLEAVEPFSSRGPVDLFFPVTSRDKPDLAGFDDVTTGVPGLSPFIGTSAAAPHVAAVAALLLAKDPFLSPAGIAAALRAGAVDVPPDGPDETTGAGRLDALGAAAAVPAPECRTRTDCGSCPIDGCDVGTCTHTAVALEVPACAGQRARRTLSSAFARACRLSLALQGAAAGRARLVRRATRALTTGMRIASRRLPAPCAAAVGHALRTARSLLPLERGRRP